MTHHGRRIEENKEFVGDASNLLRFDVISVSILQSGSIGLTVT